MRASLRYSSVGLFLVAAVACASEDAGPDGEEPGSGGTGSGTGGRLSTGGTSAGTGGSLNSGGQLSTGGGNTGGSSQATGGMWGNSSGGASATGGSSSGGQGMGTGGRFWGPGAGGANSGGSNSGGSSSGGESSGGASSGGAPSGTGGTIEIDCDATMPSSAGRTESATWAQGGSGNLAWQIWTNGGPGSITVFDDTPAFIATWNNSGDYLGRLGFEWGNNGRKYTEYGTIKADYVWNKSGTAGQYSYLGIYGWSTNPCVEWYIVEDSFHQMPFNTGDRPVGTTEIDGGTYNLVYRHTTGTGGDRCGGASSWDQFYSIRLEGKRCGSITVSDHFDAWAEQGWNLGDLLEVKIVVEAAAGQGHVEFPLANVTTSVTP